MIAPAGAGKTTLARRLFAPFEVLSSDDLRGLVSNDPTNQAASADAFELLHEILRMRLTRRLLTVIDATNVARAGRRLFSDAAAEFKMPLGAMVIALPEDEVRQRNASRPGRFAVPDDVLTLQLQDFQASAQQVGTEGFAFVHVFKTQAEMDDAVIERRRDSFARDR